jgi:hypothetical protein
MGPQEIRAYLPHFAIDGNVAASTQNVALSALLFLYRQVLHMDLPDIGNIDYRRDHYSFKRFGDYLREKVSKAEIIAGQNRS